MIKNNALPTPTANPLRRRFLRVLAAAPLALSPLASMPVARAQGKGPVIRFGSPDLGSAGHPSPGIGTAAIVQARRWLEEAFATDGIAVEWHFFRGAGPAVGEALAAGQLDVAFLGDLASIIHKASGLSMRYLVPSNRDSNLYLAVAPNAPIRTVADLRGRRVAVLKGTAYQRPFNNLLANAGLSERDVRVVNMDWPSSKAAVVGGQIDATFGASDLFMLLDQGVSLPISTRGRGPGFTINSGVLATEAFVQSRPEHTQRVVDQLVRAAHWATQETHRAELIDLFAASSGLPKVVYEAELEGVDLAQRFSPLFDADLTADYRLVLDDALRHRLVRKDFDIASWFEPSFVEQALARLDLGNAWTAQAADPRTGAT